MTLGQMKIKLNEVQTVDTLQDRALRCCALLEEAVGLIYDKTGAKQPEKASLLELVDSPIVTGYINDADTVNALHYIRILGMNAKHGRSIRKKEAKLAFDNTSYLIGLIASKENGTEPACRKPPYMSEAATRRLYIGLYPKEAGWDVLDIENLVQPAKAGIKIEVQGMPNAHGAGYCDYALYGKDGKPLAIIEVKKTSVDPEKGRHLYGECMKKVCGYKPVLYYTNGYSTKVIDGIYPDRSVMAFHTVEDLGLMLQRRNRGNITGLKINDEITNRPYQEMAITNIWEWLNAKHRRVLLVMDTCTGKTRVAISLVDILTRNNWVKMFFSLQTAPRNSHYFRVTNVFFCKIKVIFYLFTKQARCCPIPSNLPFKQRVTGSRPVTSTKKTVKSMISRSFLLLAALSCNRHPAKRRLQEILLRPFPNHAFFSDTLTCINNILGGKPLFVWTLLGLTE